MRVSSYKRGENPIAPKANIVKDSGVAQYTLSLRFSGARDAISERGPGLNRNRDLVIIDPAQFARADQCGTAHVPLSEAIPKALGALKTNTKLVILVNTLGSTAELTKAKFSRQQVLKLSTIASQLALCGLRGLDCKRSVEFCLAGCSNRDSIRKFRTELKRHGLSRFDVYGSVSKPAVVSRIPKSLR